jgi:hypothetical protein
MNYDTFKQGSGYAGLKKSYEQQGQKAMQDTLGQLAARTGGLASSYAGSAAQQSYNNYMQTLEDAARAQFNEEYSKAKDNYNMALQEYNNAYGEYRDNVADLWNRYDAGNSAFESDRSYNYQQDRDTVADQRYNQEWQYQQDRDTVADQRYNQEWQYQQDRDTVADQRYNQEWQYQQDRDTVADQRYNQEWQYQQDRDTVADQRYNQEWQYQQDQNELKNGTIMKSMVENGSLSEKNIATFDSVYGDGAYEATQRFSSIIGNIHLDDHDWERGLDEFYSAYIDLQEAYPTLSEEDLDDLIQNKFPDVWKFVTHYAE